MATLKDPTGEHGTSAQEAAAFYDDFLDEDPFNPPHHYLRRWLHAFGVWLSDRTEPG